jgi:hypothetical protein
MSKQVVHTVTTILVSKKVTSPHQQFRNPTCTVQLRAVLTLVPQNIDYIQHPSHYIPISSENMQLHVNVFLYHFTLLAVLSHFCSVTSHCKFIYSVMQSSVVQLDSAQDSTSLRSSSKYSAVDTVKHPRKFECWKHRRKNLKSRIPYTWLFFLDIKNPGRLQVLTAVTMKTTVF